MYTLTFYLPENSDAVASYEVLEGTVKSLTDYFGGATVYSGEGTWLNADGDMLRDRVHIIQCVASAKNHNYTDIKEYVSVIAKSVAIALNHEAILFTLTSDNGEAFLIAETKVWE